MLSMMHRLADGCNLVSAEIKEKRQFNWLFNSIARMLLVIFGRVAWHIGRNLR
jgi:hypothetical protein